MTEKNSADLASGRSPLSGCAIFVTAFLMLVFLLGFSVYALFRQYDEIAKFTSTAARTVESEWLFTSTAFPSQDVTGCLVEWKCMKHRLQCLRY